jgi:hypothetical protein
LTGFTAEDEIRIFQRHFTVMFTGSVFNNFYHIFMYAIAPQLGLPIIDHGNSGGSICTQVTLKFGNSSGIPTSLLQYGDAGFG